MWRLLGIAVCSLFLVGAVAGLQIFRKEVRQLVGWAQTQDDARTAAIARAKRDALEEAGVWMQSVTVVRNQQMERDDVIALSAGITRTRILEEEPFVENKAIGIRVLAEISVDNSGLQEQIQALLADRERFAEVRSETARERELLARLSELEKRMAELQGAPPAQRQALRGDVELNARRLKAKGLYDQAFAFWSGSKVQEPGRAIPLLDEALRLDPEYVAAYVRRARAHAQLERFDPALTDIDQALRLNPDFAPAYSVRGRTYFGLGKHERAIEDFSEALRRDPKHAFAYVGRARAYIALDKPRRALEDLDQAIRLQPALSTAYAARAKAYLDLGDRRQARQNTERACELGLKDSCERLARRGR